MATDDAPGPALDAALLGQLRWAVEQLRGVRYRAEGDDFRAETIILNNADALLAAAAERDALAGKIVRVLVLLGGVDLRIVDAMEADDSGDDEEEDWWRDTLALLRAGIAALAPAEGAGGDDGSGN